jgi:hypothetical protein
MKRDPGKIGRQISFELAQPENEASKKDLTRTPPKVVEFPPADSGGSDSIPYRQVEIRAAASGES